MGIYICPVCGKPLEIAGNAYKCEAGHSFDVSRSGYVNLLLSKHIGKTVHGDNKLMVRARREFLEKGYYSPLCEALCRTCSKYFGGGVLLDAGCGEGYYTSAVARTLRESGSADVYGIDISKIAVEFAAKRSPDINYSAASVFHLPVQDASCSMVITLFAPYCGEAGFSNKPSVCNCIWKEPAFRGPRKKVSLVTKFVWIYRISWPS